MGDFLLAELEKKYPLISHTRAGHLFSTVRRMRAEKEMGIPANRRSGFAISVKTGKRANEMDEQEWDNFYRVLCGELKKDFPELYYKVFPKVPNGLYQCGTCGEYKGKVREKDFPPDELGYETKNGEGYINIDCICDGILCPKCKKNKIHRPISNSYDPETNSIWHYAYFTGMMGCEKCRKPETTLHPLEDPVDYSDGPQTWTFPGYPGPWKRKSKPWGATIGWGIIILLTILYFWVMLQ